MYNTILVRTGHAHKALVRKELEKHYIIEWAKEAKRKNIPWFRGQQ